jgi:hypothetical protein
MHDYDIAIAISVIAWLTLHLLRRYTHEPEISPAAEPKK